jgi:hypothetical protein
MDKKHFCEGLNPAIVNPFLDTRLRGYDSVLKVKDKKHSCACRNPVLIHNLDTRLRGYDFVLLYVSLWFKSISPANRRRNPAIE